MRIYLTLLLTLCCLTTILGQKSEQYIITKQQNSSWICDFKDGNSENRIKILKERLNADQLVYFAPLDPLCETPINEGFNAISNTRPLYLIKAKNYAPLLLPKNPKQKLIREIQKILISENIYSIDIEEDEVSKVIYGIRGSNGIIMISLHDKAHYLKIEELINNRA